MSEAHRPHSPKQGQPPKQAHNPKQAQAPKQEYTSKSAHSPHRPHRPHQSHRPRSTPEGQHVPVLLGEVLDVLAVRPGAVVVDCTVGHGGHAAELLACVGATGRLVGLDLDANHLPAVRQRLSAIGHPFCLHQSNFAGLANALAADGLSTADAIFADLGVSSMQIDDPARGFSYMRDGPLDMRMDASRGKTSADLLATLSVEALAEAFAQLGDEPQAQVIAQAIVARRQSQPLQRTCELTELILQAAPVRIERGPGSAAPRQQRLRPVARVFQALRMLVNRETANLQALLRVAPELLRSGGRLAIISFHSGEDRLVKMAFKHGLQTGVYEDISEEPIRPDRTERYANPRSRSAKLRWAVRA